VTLRLYVRLLPDAQRVNIQIVKAPLTPVEPDPRPVEGVEAPLLCPQCLRRSRYLCQPDWYTCPVGHGVVITGEELAGYFQDALVGDV
jgi:hypothetical protein